MRYPLAILLIFLFAFNIYGQKAGYKLNSSTFDFGAINNWNNQPAFFTLTNTGKKDLVFLPTFPKEDLFVELPKGTIKPGQTADIGVYYFTASTGEFKRKIQLYINSSPDPINLTIKGEILSLGENAFIECPGFAPKAEKNLAFEQQIMVIDKETKEPVPEATVWITIEGNELITQTGKSGIAEETILAGLYDIMVEKYNYNSTSESRYVSKQSGQIIIELEPVVPVITTSIIPEEVIEETPEIFTEPEPEIFESEEPESESTQVLEDEEEFEAEEFESVELEEELEPVEIDEEVLEQVFEQPQNTEPEMQADLETIEASPFEAPIEIEVLPVAKYNPNNIVFLIDVSTSMRKPDKLPLLKASMKKLATVLRNIDKITIIAYSSSTSIAMNTTTADNKTEIISLIDSLKAEGWTHGVKGLETAYDMIESSFLPQGNNQIILATDGLFNHPNYSQQELFSLVRDKAGEDIILSVIGFGDDDDAHKLMKRLASKGNGSFLQIEDAGAAGEVLVEEIKFHSLKAQ